MVPAASWRLLRGKGRARIRRRTVWVASSGANGTHSVVRQSAQIEFAGRDYTESFVLPDARLDWPLPRFEVQNFFSPAGIVVSGPLPDEQRRVLATVENAPDETSPTREVRPGRCRRGQDVLQLAAGGDAELGEDLAEVVLDGAGADE
jgi:2-polyprenyl-6-methoxyphenol hydroxylase-like FAD-dependent oxidoreductase